jgi:hypothetical protein
VANEDILELDEAHDDRRQFDRKRLIVEIRFNGGDATGIATTRDIGLGGLYMSTKADLKEGTLLSLRMQIGNEDMIISGVVTYSDPGHGVGIRFHNLTPEAENLLRRELPLT